ncbi:MAG TPA: hydrogenase maturation nickel metallochaperone HypA [Solirubrobacteraceae bacterium]|nr:hydrogenase maturation nickel metallochaperone HypA [Solirubrobacteraceae bacterium]
MHELSLSEAILNTVVKHAAGRRVTRVELRVGQLRQVVPETLAFYFEIVARGTLCEGAQFEQERVGARLRCLVCERQWDVQIPAFRCPTCGGAEVAVAGGGELEVQSIEVEEEAVCTV